jgi:hypothetical protein
VCAALAASILAAAVSRGQEASELMREADRALRERNIPAARDALERLLAERPDYPRGLVALAGVQAQEGELDAGVETLIDAIGAGYTEFHEMERSWALAPLRRHEGFLTILAGWRELLDARGEVDGQAALAMLGPGHRIERDEAQRINFVFAQREQAMRTAREDLEAVASWAETHLLPELAEDPSRPDPWVTVLLPSAEDFMRLVRVRNVGGFYDHDQKRLVAQDLGPTLRHEFLHVLHWRLMTRTGQRHPEWIMEGLGALVEDIDLTVEGGLTPTPSWRTNIAKRQLDQNRLRSWESLFSLERSAFIGGRASAEYAHARAIMLFLWDRALLGAWMAAYVETYRQDRTGAMALERVFAAQLKEVEQDFRDWLGALPEVPEREEPGGASMGVTLTQGRGDGPRLDAFVPGGAARRAGLRLNDVLVRLDGLRVWTREDAWRILAGLRPGDEVEAELRRGARDVRVVLTLDPAR